MNLFKKKDPLDDKFLSYWDGEDLKKRNTQLEYERNTATRKLAEQQGRLDALEKEYGITTFKFPYEMKSLMDENTRLKTELDALKKNSEMLIDKAIKEIYKTELESVKKLAEKMVEASKR